MVRRSGRSRGCKTCLQRRIKCDEVTPACGQCVRTGRQCPGPLVGPILLDMGAKAATGLKHSKENAHCEDSRKQRKSPPKETKHAPEDARQSKKRKSISPTLEEQSGILDLGSTGPSGSTTATQSSSDLTITPSSSSFAFSITDDASTDDLFSLPSLSLYQPNRSEIFQTHFLSHFISSFARNHPGNMQRSWMHELPAFLDGYHLTSVNHAIRAATMAFYGSLVRNESIQVEACKWYARGLEGQRIQLRQIEAGPSKSGSVPPEPTSVDEMALDARKVVPSEEAICASIMLGYFEISCSTTPLGWFQHIQGAARLLEMRGPENCQTGIAHRMFRTVRLNMVYDSIEKRKPSIFASTAWCTTPFAIHPKTLPDSVVDVLMAIPGCMASCDQYENMISSASASESVDHLLHRARTLRTNISSLLSTLASFWSQYEAGIQSHIRQGIPGTGIYESSFVATTIARYHAAQTLLYTLLQRLHALTQGLASSPSPATASPSELPAEELDRQIEMHSAAVLSVLRFLRPGLAHNASLMQMVFPLLIVNPASWQGDQHERVERGLHELGWGVGVGASEGVLREAKRWYASQMSFAGEAAGLNMDIGGDVGEVGRGDGLEIF